MRKSQQRQSRKRCSKINRLMAGHRKLKRWWLAMVRDPLLRMGCNSRPNRAKRLEILTSGRKESPVYRRTHPDWNMMAELPFPPPPLAITRLQAEMEEDKKALMAMFTVPLSPI